jgi:hypothetical protein
MDMLHRPHQSECIPHSVTEVRELTKDFYLLASCMAKESFRLES